MILLLKTIIISYLIIQILTFLFWNYLMFDSDINNVLHNKYIFKKNWTKGGWISLILFSIFSLILSLLVSQFVIHFNYLK